MSEPRCGLLLVVDDDELFRSRLERALCLRGYGVITASSVDTALEQVSELSASAGLLGAVIDLRMPGSSGLSLISPLRERFPAARLLVLTGYGSIATALEAIRKGASNYLMKPADADEILAALELANKRAIEVAVTTPSLATVEWEHINRVLSDCKGNITRAAKLLGIHRRSLQRKLLKHP